MSPYHELRIAGQRLWLLAQRGVYLPDEQTLLVADLHIGKAASFRALGVPVPRGTTEGTLSRLTQLLELYPTQRLVILGDFLHAVHAHAPGTRAALSAWRERHADLQCDLVKGNHDRHAGDPASHLRIEVHREPIVFGGLALCHEPRMLSDNHVIAGHIHPVYRLHSRARQRLRLPCFVHEPTLTLLPAFGEFTGGALQDFDSERKIFVTTDAEVWPISA